MIIKKDANDINKLHSLDYYSFHRNYMKIQSMRYIAIYFRLDEIVLCVTSTGDIFHKVIFLSNHIIICHF